MHLTSYVPLPDIRIVIKIAR